ncbi:condensation domain-containing protein [Cellulomonas sp. URHB0016]
MPTAARVDPPVGVRTATLTVPFEHGEDARAPLTWGQQRVAGLERDLHPDHATLTIRFAVRLRDGATTTQVEAALRATLEACESLRTLVRTDAEPPYQHVLAAGELVVPVVEVPGDVEAVDAGAEVLAGELASRPFADGELPLRVCVVTSGGTPHALAVAASHVAADYFGAGWLQWHLRDVLARRFGRSYQAHAVADPRQPRHLSEWENGEQGRATAERSVTRHSATYREMPQTMVPRLPHEPLAPRFRYLELTTRRGNWSLAHLGTRHGVSETAVLYGLLSLLLARVGGLSRSHLQVCVSNRADRRFASTVAPLTQDVPTWIDVAGTSFDDLLRRSAGVMLAAVKDGRFPPSEMERARVETERRRGTALDLSFWLNSRLGGAAPRASAPTPAELTHLQDESHVREVGGDPRSTSTLFVYADRADGVLQIRVLVDTAYVTVDEARAWLRAVDDLLCTAAADPDDDIASLAARCGLHAPPRDGTWAFVDHSWVHLPTAASCLRRLLPAGRADLEVGEGPGGAVLVGVVDDLALLDEAARRADAATAYRGTKAAMFPHRFRARTTHPG